MRKLSLVFAVGVCLVGFSNAAHAADKVEVSGGYSFLNDTTASQTLNGWYGSIGGYFNQSFGAVAEVGGNYTTVTVVGTSVSVSEFSFLGGPKFAAHVNPKVTPFVQMLLGGVRFSGGALGVSVSETDFAIQPGAGVDVALTPNVAFRLEGDYRGVFPSGSTENHFRFAIGITFHQ